MTSLKSLGLMHTPYETYKVYGCLPCTSELFKGINRWLYYKCFRTKQGALAYIRRYKEKAKNTFEKDLMFRIVWCESPYAIDEKCYVLYDESLGGER